MKNENVRSDQRETAPVCGMDLSQSTSALHRAIVARIRVERPFVVAPHWELDEGETVGWVYSASNRIVAKLVHVSGAS